jgi:hypothetical protein
LNSFGIPVVFLPFGLKLIKILNLKFQNCFLAKQRILKICSFVLQMLKQGAAKPSTYAPLKSAAILSVVPQPRKNDDSEPEPEDYVPPPPKASLGDALAQAFVQAKTGNGNSAAANKPEVAKKSGKKGKKMKGQKISLTGSGRPIMD